MRTSPLLSLRALAAAALLALAGCAEPELEETLEFDFEEDLSRYDSVRVLLVDPEDTSRVLEVVFEGSLEPGQSLPRYALKDLDGKDFVVSVIGYDDGLVAYRNDIARQGDVVVANLVPDTSLPGGAPALGGLQVSAGILSPSFHKDTLVYRLSVPHEDSVLVLTPLIPGVMAGATIQGDPAASGEESDPIFLRLGGNVIEVKVVTQGGKVRVYTLTVVRARGGLSTLSGLSLLTVSAGALVPPFHKDTLEYRVFAAEGGAWAALSALAEDDSASVGIPPLPASKGVYQGNLALRAGTNVVDVKVTAEDGTTTRTYRLTITVPPNPLGGH